METEEKHTKLSIVTTIRTSLILHNFASYTIRNFTDSTVCDEIYFNHIVIITIIKKKTFIVRFKETFQDGEFSMKCRKYQ